MKTIGITTRPEYSPLTRGVRSVLPVRCSENEVLNQDKQDLPLLMIAQGKILAPYLIQSIRQIMDQVIHIFYTYA